MVEEETTQDQSDSEVPQDQDAPDPRLISRVIEEADPGLASWEEKAQEPPKDEEPES